MPQTKLSIIELESVLLCLIAGLSDAEVIEYTGVSRGTVKRYRRVVERAREEIAAEMVDELIQGKAG